jgi:hypothetical protein
MRLALFTLLFLTACANVCERGEALNKSFPERHAACFAQDTLPGTEFDSAACDTSMSACSKTDEAALHQYFDCVERLPVCTQANKQAFNDKFLECANGMNRISEGCFRP